MTQAAGPLGAPTRLGDVGNLLAGATAPRHDVRRVAALSPRNPSSGCAFTSEFIR